MFHILLFSLNDKTGLPDAASIEAAGFVEPDNDRTVVIDASTAFRVDENWVYGFPGMCLVTEKFILTCFVSSTDH
jgi:N-acetyl-gamma-glutamylphosphate reductase